MTLAQVLLLSETEAEMTRKAQKGEPEATPATMGDAVMLGRLGQSPAG